MTRFIFLLLFMLLLSCRIDNNRCEKCLLESSLPIIDNQDSVIFELKKELLNPEIKNNYSIIIDSIISVLQESKHNHNLFFPYRTVDSVIVFSCSYMEKSNYKNVKKSRLKCLNIKEFNLLALVLNNPLYYVWGECGTPILEHSVSFYHKGKEVGKVDISCETGFIECFPTNLLIKFGGLNNQGIDIVKGILYR